MSDPGDPMEVGEPRGSNNPIGIGEPMESSPIRPLSPNGSIPTPNGQFPDIEKSLDSRAIKIAKAKNLLNEILKETSDSNLHGPILEGIQILEIIEKGIHNPQENHLSTHQAIQNIQLEIAKINSKVDSFLEPRKPTFAEILQKPIHSEIQNQPKNQSNQPPSPMVVIPKRPDLNPDDYPMASFPSSKLGPSPRSAGSVPSRPNPRPSQLDEFRAKRLIIKTSMEFLNKLSISDDDRAKIAYRNAERLLRI